MQDCRCCLVYLSLLSRGAWWHALVCVYRHLPFGRCDIWASCSWACTLFTVPLTVLLYRLAPPFIFWAAQAAAACVLAKHDSTVSGFIDRDRWTASQTFWTRKTRIGQCCQQMLMGRSFTHCIQPYIMTWAQAPALRALMSAMLVAVVCNTAPN